MVLTLAVVSAFIYGAGVVAAMFVLFFADYHNEHPTRNMFIIAFWPLVWLGLLSKYAFDKARGKSW